MMIRMIMTRMNGYYNNNNNNNNNNNKDVKIMKILSHEWSLIAR